ncbi:CACTA transposable element [Tanacetum coccineum]
MKKVVFRLATAEAPPSMSATIITTGLLAEVMTIDKSWTFISNRNSGEFLRGLRVFLEHCKTLLDPISGEIACPCDLCGNSQTGSIKTLWTHISENGFDSTYTIWDKHGESLPPPPQPPSPKYDNMAAFLDEIIRPDNESTQTTGPQPTQTTGPQPTQTTGPHIDNEFEALFSRAADKLYPCCTWMTSLDFLAKMPHAKVLGKITDNGFNLILKVLQEAFPHREGFKIPSSYYEMKKTYKKIRWKDHKTKGKKVANKVENGQMNHPVDGKAWKFFDIIHSKFAKDPRNIRLGLVVDGFNPFGNLSQTYNMWPVIMTTYNTPTWMCMKETSFMLTMLIPGPKSPAKDIDVFLQPLIKELQTLWSRVWTRDVVTGTDFKMKAALLWTINDFPAPSSLSGWSGQGYLACLTCNKDTPSAKVIGKIVYVGHRKFLRLRHTMRMKMTFNGKIDMTPIPKTLTNADIMNQLRVLPRRVPGKHSSNKKKPIDRNVEFN